VVCREARALERPELFCAAGAADSAMRRSVNCFGSSIGHTSGATPRRIFFSDHKRRIKTVDKGGCLVAAASASAVRFPVSRHCRPNHDDWETRSELQKRKARRQISFSNVSARGRLFFSYLCFCIFTSKLLDFN